MKLIPVIDLKDGQVVHAAGGVRQDYQRLNSPLCASATLASVADGLLKFIPSSVLYIADLDAIAGKQGHVQELTNFCLSHQELTVWLDCGFRSGSMESVFDTVPNITPVLGSETLLDAQDLVNFRLSEGQRVMLSLDFKGREFLGPPELLQQTDLWPSSLIVMTLDAVGAGRGPDWELVSDVLERAGAREVFAAGGVRDVADLKRLGDLGAAGALVSTALHRGHIKPDDLEEIAGF